jgi:hypothetical protein
MSKKPVEKKEPPASLKEQMIASIFKSIKENGLPYTEEDVTRLVEIYDRYLTISQIQVRNNPVELNMINFRIYNRIFKRRVNISEFSDDELLSVLHRPKRKMRQKHNYYLYIL